MSYFVETGIAFKNQVTRIGLMGAMTFETATFNILKTPDADRWDVTLNGARLVKESIVDVLRDDFTFFDGTTWTGINSTTLYNRLTNASSQDKRPEVTIGTVLYQIHRMDDDAADACVKLAVRRKEV